MLTDTIERRTHARHGVTLVITNAASAAAIAATWNQLPPSTRNTGTLSALKSDFKNITF